MDDNNNTNPISTEGMPSWLIELIDRLMQVFTKLMIKFGLKLIF